MVVVKRLLFRVSLLVLLLSVIGTTVAVAQSSSAREKIDVSKLGPQVGEKVPEFSLKDQYGKPQTLQSIMGPKGAMLVFVRSADWCPYCKTQLVDLQSRAQEIRKAGLGIATISYDAPELIAAFAERHSITFPMLSDVGSETIKRYGILNTVAMELAGPRAKDPALADDIKMYVSVTGGNARMAGIAFPGTFVLDGDGRVKSRFFDDFYVTRSTYASILMKAGGGNPVSGTRVSTEHLEITAYPSDAAAAPGNRITLVLEIAPRRGMHVYAPGAQSYRVIELKLAPESPFRAMSSEYPPSRIYFFKPLNERVPVYEKPFSLRQDVVLDGTPQSQAALRGKDTVTLNATLEYQACDANTCYLPQSVPLSWTFTLRPIVFDRPAPLR
jgi:peroxiredoxin